MEKCPVCGKSDVDNKCPQCRTDLTNWGRLIELPSAYYNRAVHMIKEGKLWEAKVALFTAIGLSPEDVEALILLGKVCAEMGNYEEAITYWEKAKKLDENKAEYLDSYITKARSLTRKEDWEEKLFATINQGNQFIKRWIIYMFLAFIILGIGGGGFLYKMMGVKLEKLRETPAVQEIQKTSAAPSMLKINIPCIATKTVGQQQMLVFEQGLFLSGQDLITADAEKILDSLAQDLQKQAEKFNFIIEGHTDDLPILQTGRWNNNYELGLHRAFRVANYFVSKHNLPKEKFLITSAGEMNPPFPNTPENRSKNRTVVIKIIPNKGTERR